MKYIAKLPVQAVAANQMQERHFFLKKGSCSPAHHHRHPSVLLNYNFTVVSGRVKFVLANPSDDVERSFT